MWQVCDICMYLYEAVGCLREVAIVRETYRFLASCSCSHWGAVRGRRSVWARTFPSAGYLENLVLLGLVWSGLWNSTPLQQYHNNNQDGVSLCLADETGTGWSQRWPGEKKTRGWGQRLGKWNLHSGFSLTEAHKGACMCGSSFERTEIMTLSNIPVKMSCLAQSPVIS